MDDTSIIENTIEDIISEVRKLDALEQKAILAYIKARRLHAKKNISLARYGKGIKPLTMAEINKIKHLSRKTNAQ